MTNWITPSGEDLSMTDEVLDKSKGEGKLDADEEFQHWTPLNAVVVMVFATICALVLHWAGVI